METLEEQMQEYINSLSEKEKEAYLLAKELLGMSFQLEKSLGFIEWQQKQKEN